jgi:putative hydrolase of the HAD superfamily
MRAILFDFGGTLDFPKHWLDRFVEHYRAAGILIKRTELEPAFSLATHEAYGRTEMLRHYSLSQLVGLLVELQFVYLGIEDSSAPPDLLARLPARCRLAELKAQIRDSFVTQSEVGFGISRPVLISLASRFKLGVVSNFYGNLERVIADAGLAGAITVTTDSGRLGFHKPDPRIFSTSLAQLDVPPHEAAMVGDSIRKDCAPARAMGLRTIWLRHRESKGQDGVPSDSVDFTIDSLEELDQLRWLTG